MSKLSDETLENLRRMTIVSYPDQASKLGAERHLAGAVPALVAELRDLRALLATPMPCGWEIPMVDDDEENGGKCVRWGGDVYEDPDDALAIGAGLIRAALEARGGE